VFNNCIPGGPGLDRNFGRKFKAFFEFTRLFIINVGMIFPAVAFISNPDIHAAGFDGKGIRPHEAELTRQAVLYGIYGRKNANKGHNPKSDNQNGKDGPQETGSDRLEGNGQVFPKQQADFHLLLFKLKVRKSEQSTFYLRQSKDDYSPKIIIRFK
jgi:hypothetical protein